MNIPLRKTHSALFCLLLAIVLLISCGTPKNTAESAAEETASGTAAGSTETESAPEAASESTETESAPEAASESAETVSAPEAAVEVSEAEAASEGAETAAAPIPENVPDIPGLVYTGHMAPEYTSLFDVYYYEDGYALIDVFNDARYLLIPEGGDVPEGFPEDIFCLHKPFERIYIASTAVYGHFYDIGEMDHIRFTSSQKGAIFISEVDERLERGDYLFAGKYSTPDYETLVEGDCDLAVENTGIYHVPEVKEMLEELQIPVFVDRSSYEGHPLGRTEWIRLYGLLTDKAEEADVFFEEQKQKLEEATAAEPTGKTVLFFYMTGEAIAVIRQPDDYIVKMIELAGGEYSFKDYTIDTSSATPKISMEELYAAGKDADIILYNATMESPLSGIDDLLDLNPLFADFKAVRDDMVFTTNGSLFQRADICGEFTEDVKSILQGQKDAQLQFLTKVE